MMNEKTYKLAGCTQFKAIMMVEKQTLFQSLFLILSQLEELDEDNYQIFKETIEDTIGATVRCCERHFVSRWKIYLHFN